MCFQCKINTNIQISKYVPRFEILLFINFQLIFNLILTDKRKGCQEIVILQIIYLKLKEPLNHNPDNLFRFIGKAGNENLRKNLFCILAI